MTERRHARAAIAMSLVAVFLLVMPTAAPAQSNAASLIIQEVDASGYPDVSLRVSVPPSALGDLTFVEFSVLENGRRVDEVQVLEVLGEATPAKVLLLMDTSGSMEGQPLADAKAAAWAFIEAMGPDASVAIMSFADGAAVLSPFTGSDSQLDGAIGELSPGGETALYDGVVSAAQLIAGASGGQRAIVVLSDGGDTVSSNSFERAMEVLGEVGVPVYAVALHSDEYNPQALATMAEGSGGRLMSVSESGDLAALFEGIAEEIQGAYVLSYTSARPRSKDIELDVTASTDSGSLTSGVAYTNPMFDWEPATPEEDSAMEGVGGSPQMLVGVALLAFVSVTLMVVGTMSMILKQPTGLEQLEFYDQLHEPGGGAVRGSATDNVRMKMVEAVESVAGKRGFTGLFADRLERAGLPLRPGEYMTLHIFFVVVTGLFAQIVFGNLVISLIVVVSASVGPLLALDVRVEGRKRKFEQQLPDVLGMIASSLRGGWGLSQAIDFVVEQSASPASEEFRRTQTEARLGKPLDAALVSMADRLDSLDFSAAVTAMAIQREVGGNLAEVLDIVAKTVRDRAALKRQIAALTAEGRISAVILALLPVIEIVALLVISPTYLTPMLTTGIGLFMSVGGFILMVVGVFWLRRVTKIEV